MSVHKFFPSQNRKGFSLVELMSVVAILGILSIIGIPQYQRFTARARQAEAKTHLTKIYQSEISFYSEHNSYTGNLRVLGAAALGRNLRYDAGFRDGEVCVNETVATPATADDNNNVRVVSSAADASWYYATAGIADTGNVSVSCSSVGFTAGAWGNPTNIPAGANNNADLFSIDQDKQISHLNIGF